MKRYFTQFILIFAVVFSLLSTGCPPKAQVQKTVRDFKVKSAELSVYGTKLIAAFGDAYRAGEITKEQLQTLNRGTGAFVDGVGVYRTAITQAEAIVNSGQPLPANTLSALSTILNDQVIAAFFDILVRVGGMSLAQSETVKAIISGIRLTILAISGAFSDARQLIRHQEALSWT